MTEEKTPIIEASEIVSMFPTLVWKAQLTAEAHQSVSSEVIGWIREARKSLEDLAPGASWQSGNDLQRLEEFQGLLSCVHDVGAAVLTFLKISEAAVMVTGCWVNVSKGAGHKAHSHPNNYLSGVYYVQTQEGTDLVDFHDPRPQTNIIRPPVTELTAQNTDQVTVRVKNGMLLLFPSWLQHSVPPSRSAKERISVSFNIMFSSYTEKMSKPLW